jgi:FMN phosphatase YigB (HAD superfamily)
VDAVIFDWGGTLTPWRNIDHAAGWRAYADVLHPDDTVRAEAVAAALFAADNAAWRRVKQDGKAFRLAEVLAVAGVAEDEAAYLAYRTFWEPATFTDPDVVPLMAALRERGLRTGVLSSTAWPGDWHEEILRRDGALDSFDACVWTSSLAWTKPNAAAFTAAMAAVGATDPSRCVYVGDRMYDDVHGAKSVGMRAVFVPHSEIPADQLVAVDVAPDAVVHRLADLVPIIDQWLEP